MNNRKKIILYFGTYEEDYSRNQIMIQALEKMGHQVKTCHISLWQNKVDKTEVFSNFFSKLSFFIGLLTIYPRLFLKYLSSGPYDVMWVGYFGHLDMIFATLFQTITLRRKKIIFDVFYSLYDSLVNDRKLVQPGAPLARITYGLDRLACRLADGILLDTLAHIDFFHKTFKIPKQKMVRIFASADTSVFYPRKVPVDREYFNVLFMGKYTPLHGIEYIVETASILHRHQDIRFTFIGKGQLLPKIRRQVEKKNLKNIHFINWVPYEQLPDHIEGADVALGIFADSGKAARVIPNKVFQAMAMGKAVITADTMGAAEALVHHENAWLCKPADPHQLAEAIITLKADSALRHRLGENAKQTFDTQLSDRTIQADLERLLTRPI